MKFGPTKRELQFRIAFSAIGLGLLGLAIGLHGIPRGPAFFETVIIASGFFGGTLGYSLWKLAKGRYAISSSKGSK